MSHESGVPVPGQLILIFHVLTLALAPGCGERAQRPARDSAVAASPAAPRVRLARYIGVLPCADCSGIRTDLILFVAMDSTTPAGYLLRETYLGAKEGDQIFESEGAWRTVHGSSTDPRATIYQLDIGQPDELRHFLRLGPDSVRQLDKDRAPIESRLNYTLNRVP